MPRTVLAFAASLALLFATAATAQAQIASAPGPAGGTRIPTLRETLNNNLRATTREQQEFVRRVEKLVGEQQLDARLVFAIMRYSQRRSPGYPFPYFERAMRYEASKRGVHLPPVAVIASTALPHRR